MDVRPGGRVLQGPPFSGRVAELPADGIPFNVGEIEGRLPDSSADMPEVIASESLFGARVPKPEIGSELPFVLAKGMVNVKIVGFFKMSGLVPAFPTLYVNKAAMETVAKLSPDFRPLPNLLLVVTGTGANPADIGLVIDEVPEADACQLYTVDAVASRFRSDTVSHLVSQLPMSLTLAVITASCLMATVLLIGVALQRRRIAELRCAGMTRGGVARLLLAETALMVVPGWLFGLGLSALCLQIFLWTESGGGELPSVIHLGWQTPVFSAVLAVAVGGLAVIVPALRAMRVKPLEVIGNDISESRPVSPLKAVLAVCLLLPLPLVAMEPALPEALKSALMLCVCLPCFIASLVLGMHPLMRLVEIVFLRPVGWMLHLDPKLLQRRLSRDPARAAGTVLTLALGLGGFVAIHIWGGTLMSSFVPSPEWPDVIVSALPSGLTAGQVDAIRTCEGVADGRVVDIECTQFPMELNDGTSPEGVLLLFGADPLEAFGEKALAPFRFIEGDRVEAACAMAAGDCC
ncbi:MAG: FtsX-like permease family protein, partial [Kiritimatiellae bacterium]|nr:FtsX-like permease family protein [Kiritimatiellia bacterium]